MGEFPRVSQEHHPASCESVSPRHREDLADRIVAFLDRFPGEFFSVERVYLRVDGLSLILAHSILQELKDRGEVKCSYSGGTVFYSSASRKYILALSY